MDGKPTHHTRYQHSTNTTTSTIFSTVSHPLSTMTTTTTHPTINTTSPTPTTSHNDTRQNTTIAHTRITTTTNRSQTAHILKTICQHTTVRIPSTSTSPSLCTSPNTAPLPITPNQLSTTTSKPKIKPSKHIVSPSEHLLFILYFIPNRPKFIFKLNLPTNLARLCTEIQHDAELSIIKRVEDYLTKQNKHKNGNKNKPSNKKVLNYKPRFTPREHKPTSPIHTLPPTDITTATPNTRPRFKQHTSTITTQYTQPTHIIHTSTCTKPQLPPQYTTVFHSQPNTHHTLKYTRTTN